MDPTCLKNHGMNSPYNITIRGEEAKYKREVLDLQRRQNEMQRTFRQNKRKLKVTQCGVLSLLGREPYPDCHPDNILFSHNQPGFCYRRNGTPRRFTSLVESKTRKILDDLEGNLGYLEEQATNIVSDNPMLTEVLSSPEIVSILCNLRSTSAIMKNSRLFRQFVLNIQKSSPKPLRFKEETPYGFLRQYRTDLINQFFEALQVQAEIRLSSDLPNEAVNNLIVPPENATGVSSLGEKVDVRNELVEIEEFTTALKAGLLEAQAENFRPKFLSQDILALDDSESPYDPIIKQQLLQLGLRKIESVKGLSPSVYGFHENRPRRKHSTVTIAPIPPPNTSETTPSQAITRNFMRPENGINKDNLKSRNEFDTFVRNLITEVENVLEAGKTLRTIRGQNAAKNNPNNPSHLIKLLKKRSLFSSLTEDDLLFYEYEGGKKGAEKNLAKALHLTPNNGPLGQGHGYNYTTSGFGGQVPTREDSILTTEYSRENSAKSGPDGSNPRGNTSISYNTCETLTSASDNTHCSGRFKSINRVCCRACKARVWQDCNAARARDTKDKSVGIHWKPPGVDEWTNNFASLHKTKNVRIKGVPTPSRKNYLYDPSGTGTTTLNIRPNTSEVRDEVNQTRLHTGDIPGAPTPVGARNKFFPSLKSPGDASSSSKKSGDTTSVFYGSNKSDSFSFDRRRSHGAQSGPSWTLKISRLDILKLRHELDVEHIRGDLENFEKRVLKSKIGSAVKLE